jgi:hypothetical protein
MIRKYVRFSARTTLRLGNARARIAELQRIQKEEVPQRFGRLSQILIKIDQRHAADGTWGDLYVDPQDQIYKRLDTLCNGVASPTRCDEAFSELEIVLGSLRNTCELKALEMRHLIKGRP